MDAEDNHVIALTFSRMEDCRSLSNFSVDEVDRAISG